MSEPPSLLRYLAIDLCEGLRDWWRRSWRWGGLLALALLPLFALACWDLIAGAGAGDAALTILVAAAMDLFYGLCGGAIAASVALLWRLFGATLIVALLLAPLLFFAVLIFFGPWVGALGLDLLTSWGEAIAASPSLSGPEALAGLGRVGHAGPAALIVLVLLLPLILIWIGKAALLLLVPPVLWHFLALLGVSALVLALSLLLAICVPGPFLVVALIRRLRRRHREHLAGLGADATARADNMSF